MRKLKLELDTLAVESFETARIAAAAGTVRARGITEPEPIDVAEPTVVVESADGKCTIAITATWWNTCPAGCGDTNYISCVTRCSCRTQPCDTCV